MDLKRCLRWIVATGNESLCVEYINKGSYVCGDHFLVGGPSAECPDPIPRVQVISLPVQSVEGKPSCSTGRQASLLRPKIKVITSKKIIRMRQGPYEVPSPKPEVVDEREEMGTEQITTHTVQSSPRSTGSSAACSENPHVEMTFQNDDSVQNICKVKSH